MNSYLPTIGNLEEIDVFLETSNLLRLNHEEAKNSEQTYSEELVIKELRH